VNALGIDPREARLLLAAATGYSEASLLAFPERGMPPEVEKAFLSSVARRKRGEPIAYILGRKEFYSLDLEVTPAVLVPRPETELLVDLALERRPASALDLGTGSGAIALALKKHLPACEVTAVDSDESALALAGRNAQKHRLAVGFLRGSWLLPVRGRKFQAIVSNPPYIALGDPHLPELRHEPQGALVSGADGLDAIREIAREGPGHLEPGGWLLVEHGAGQDEAVRQLFAAAGLEEVRTWPDLAGIPRVTGGKR
jgi:release factor glutamine methyltransferase